MDNFFFLLQTGPDRCLKEYNNKTLLSISKIGCISNRYEK